MQVKVESTGKSQIRLHITAEAERLTKALDATFEDNRSKYPVEGTAPEALTRAQVEAVHGNDVFLQEAVGRVFLPQALRDAARQAGVDPVSEPVITFSQLEPGKQVVFTADTTVKPEVKLGQYKGLRVMRPCAPDLTDEEWAQAQKDAEAQNAAAVPVDRAARDGDTVRIDFTGFLNGTPFLGGAGTDYPLTLGSGTFIEGFEDQLVGVSPGERVEVHVTFPEAYPAKELCGQAVVFQVTVKAVTERQLRPLTEEQKVELRETLTAKKAQNAEMQVEDEIMTQVMLGAQMEVPEAMLETQTKLALADFSGQLAAKGMNLEDFYQQTGKTESDVLAELRPNTLQQIQVRLVIEAIAKAEKITATPEDMEAQWAAVSAQTGFSKEQILENLGQNLEAEMQEQIVVKKTFDLLRDTAEYL